MARWGMTAVGEEQGYYFAPNTSLCLPYLVLVYQSERLVSREVTVCTYRRLLCWFLGDLPRSDSGYSPHLESAGASDRGWIQGQPNHS